MKFTARRARKLNNHSNRKTNGSKRSNKNKSNKRWNGRKHT